MVQSYGDEHRTPNNLESESIYNEFGSNSINQQSISSSPSSSSASSSTAIETSSISMISSTVTYICIITDMTNASNTYKNRVINLSSTYSVDNLIQEAANFFDYEPSSFSLMWKQSGELLNISELYNSTITLGELGLTAPTRNIFEIHEKEGPPKKLKIDTFNDTSEFQNLDLTQFPIASMSRRNASNDVNDYEPNNNDFNNIYSPSNNSKLDNENMGYVGLINQAMTCYLNSLIQTLFMTPEFRNGIYRWNYNDINEDDGKKSIPFQLQRLFLNLQTSNKKSIQTSDLTKSFGWNSDDAFQQHDVQELCRVMFDALEKNFKGTEQGNLINELYQGKIKDYVKCLECNVESARINVFLDISLCIKPFGSDKTYESIEEALDAFVQPEILDENNKYYCDKCNKMCKAHKGLKFESFPYIISLQLNRFDFDYSTMSRFKISNRVSFPEVINIKKYLNLNEEKEENNENNNYDYELFSIMIHSGSATGGHYYAFIKSFETDEWYNFNDERVSRLDKRDISKAFGTSYSSYSSTTAYMLFYRQINLNRNEKFIKTEYFNDYLKNLLEKEKNQQLEADRLKEYIENSCKIKVIVPSFVNNENLSQSNFYNNDKNSKFTEKLVNIHKDLTLEQAKLELLKQFNLNDNFDPNKKKCRILKYDTYNDLIEESYENETANTVFEVLGFTKYPYGFCWYLEIFPIDHEFIEYSSNDFNVKVININMTTFETNELFNLRLKCDSTVMELRDQISNELNTKDKEQFSYLIRMALEKPHSLNNFVYLNKNLYNTLKSQSFTRVNKVFIEYEITHIDDEQNKLEFNNSLEYSKFSYALEAIMNMLQMIVYLPIEEQCETFLRKTQRRLHYIEKQRNLSQDNIANNEIINQNFEKNENCLKNKMQCSKSSNLMNDKCPELVGSKLLSSIDENNVFNDIKNLTQDDLLSKINSQSTENHINLIENHFNSNINKQYEMDTGFDEHMSECTKCEDDFNDVLIKTSPSNLNYELLNEKCNNTGNLVKNKYLNQINSDNDEKLTQNIEEDDKWDRFDDLDVNVDDNEINNIDDFNENTNSNINDENPIDDEDIESGDILKSNEMIVSYDDTIENIIHTDKNAKDDLDSNSKFENLSNIPRSVKFISPNEEFYLENQGSLQRIDNDSNITSKTTILRVKNNSIDDFNDELPKYAELNQKENVNIDENKQMYDMINNNCFIKSKLIVNPEMGAGTLEIRMDKRIDLNEFKSHINKYLKIGSDNFRVFRMCPNDLECELTSSENQFSYLAQNSKFIIKLGPPLKYGEYVLPVYMLDKTKGSISFLCEFMIAHGLSVFNHKELLRDDLQDECNLNIDIKRMRLRKKISKRPGTILLDHEIFGADIFMNAMSEICIEILDGEEKKTIKNQTSVYLRHWKPNEYELSELIEIIINGNTFDVLFNHISSMTGIPHEDLELLKCKRDFPFKSPILDLHKDLSWKDNYFLPMEKLEDGVCFYFRNKSLKLGEISDEKRREMVKEENINFRPSLSFGTKKEIGVKIHIEKN